MAPSRIDELRRRVQSDPASIAFAQLAEEYRRSGQTEEAVRVCREGLTRHPGYLSARVTLGRALLDLGQLLGARQELEFVVAEAPENLAAVRGLAEISHREGQTAEALTYYQRALALARHDPEIEEIVQQLSRQLGAAAAGSNGGLSFEEAHQELLSAAERLPVTTPPHVAPDRGRDAAQGSTAPFDFDRLVAALGSPSAPPQVEAAVDGRPSTISLDLPEPVGLGPDPFAALEAELRANDAVQGSAKPAPWESRPVFEADESDTAHAADAAGAPDAPDAPPPVTYGEAMAADVPEAVEEPAADVFEPLAPAWELDAKAVADVEAYAVGVGSPDDSPAPSPAEVVAPVVRDDYDIEAEGLAAAEATTEVPAAAPPAAPAPEPAQEGVLDELESWLTTLQDRSSQ